MRKIIERQWKIEKSEKSGKNSERTQLVGCGGGRLGVLERENKREKAFSPTFFLSFRQDGRRRESPPLRSSWKGQSRK